MCVCVCGRRGGGVMGWYGVLEMLTMPETHCTVSMGHNVHVDVKSLMFPYCLK